MPRQLLNVSSCFLISDKPEICVGRSAEKLKSTDDGMIDKSINTELLDLTSKTKVTSVQRNDCKLQAGQLNRKPNQKSTN